MTQENFNKIYAELFAQITVGTRREQASTLRAMSRLEKLNPEFVAGAQAFIAAK